MFLIYVYLIFFFIIVYFVSERDSILNNKYLSKIHLINLMIMSLVVVLSVDLNYTDRINYNYYFESVKNMTIYETLINTSIEPMFILTTKFISFFTNDLLMYYLIFHLIFLIILYIGLNKIFEKNHNLIILTLFIFVNYPIYYGYTLNGIRQGMAMSLLILAIGFGLQGMNKSFLITLLATILFHQTSILAAISLIIVFYLPKVKINYFVILYLFMSVLYIFDLQMLIFGEITIKGFESYSDITYIKKFGGSNKLIYWIFNTAWLLFGLYFLRTDSKINIVLLKVFILFSIFFLVFGYIAYANRVASYSWFILPLMIAKTIEERDNISLKILIVLIFLNLGILQGVPKYLLNS